MHQLGNVDWGKCALCAQVLIHMCQLALWGPVQVLLNNYVVQLEEIEELVVSTMPEVCHPSNRKDVVMMQNLISCALPALYMSPTP